MVEAQGLPNGVRVDYAPEASVPEVPMDVEKLKQVVLNIVLNGLEAMDERGGTLRVRARARRDGGEADSLTSLRRFANGEFSEVRVKRGSVAGGQVVELVFEDEGDGIRQTDAGKLFIPFFTTKTEGNGLGLPICERIMREHGGEIEIESTAGRGTRFSLRLPLQQEPHPDPR